MRHLIFVDCEAQGTSPVNGTLTGFGAVHYPSKVSFYGQLFESHPDPGNPAVSVAGRRLNGDYEIASDLTRWLLAVCGAGRPVMVSDNPAWDFMWIAGLSDSAGLPNPFGHSARRISDFWAGLHRDWVNTQEWKRLRRTKHDHHPVNDAMGNLEAFERIMQMVREGKFGQAVRDGHSPASGPVQAAGLSPASWDKLPGEVPGQD